MIQASYHSNLQPDRVIAFKDDNEGFVLVNGRLVRSVLDILELKGFNAYAGSFNVDGNDLLDVTNANRDRSPVSVIAASSLTFQVTRSQVPLGVVAKTDKIDAATKKYIEEKAIPHDWQLNFIHLFQSLYAELCAHPSYVVLDLARTDKQFAIDVVDLVDKVLGKYRIYGYAPQLFEKPMEDVTFYGDIKDVLSPKPALSRPANEHEMLRTQAMASFIDDLAGAQPEDRQEAVATEQSEETPKSSHHDRHENSQPLSQNSSTNGEESSKESGGFFHFDPKKTDMYNFIFSCIFLILAMVISFLYFTFTGTNSNLFFIICLIMSLLFTIMSIVPIRTLNKDNNGKHIRDSKYLFLSMVIFPSGCTLVGGALVAVGYLSSHFTKAWNHLYFWLFACVFFVYSVVLLLYLYFTNKVFLKDDKNEQENK
jgi:hypothetical protein